MAGSGACMEAEIVRTRKEPKQAVKARAERIIVRGGLAEKLQLGWQLQEVPEASLGMLSLLLGMAPFTGGISAAVAARAAALTGLEFVAIIAVASVGIALILLICREYTKACFLWKKGDLEAELELKRNAAAA